MTEEIIIDGVNVAGCNAYKEEHCLDKTAILLCDTNKCSNYKDCYYKQLKRLEQENFALTQESQQKSQTICDLKQENEELKKERNILLGQLVINDGEDVTVQISQSQFEQYNKYRSALEEIREVADKCKECLNEDDDCGCDYLRIVRKINEVLNNE